MKIGIIQNHITDNIEENIASIKEQLLNTEADLAVLPEIWNCPYENEIMKQSASYFDASYSMLKEVSRQKKMWIVAGTMAHQKNNKLYNTCFVFDDNGNEVIHYDKTHLFELHAYQTDYKESDVFEAGHQLISFQMPWAKVGLLVCYDIRFPEVSRLLAQSGCEILCCPAQFNPTTGKLHWKLFNQTRAIENEVFFIGVQPGYYEYKGFSPYGHSMITDPAGNILVAMENEVASKVIEIQIEDVKKTREKMPYWKVRRDDLYELKEK